MEMIGSSSEDLSEDKPNPSVRAFVRNFERHDSTPDSGGDAKPPVMTRSKVAQLRSNLGQTAGSIRRVKDSDDIQKTNDGDNSDANTSSEYIVSVARLKESLQKSANEKRVAPWAFGGVGRSVKEPKKPVVSHNTNETADDGGFGNRSKQQINSFAKTDVPKSFAKSEISDENTPAYVDVTRVNASDSQSSKVCPSNVLGRASSRDATEKPKVVPKVLPKPAIRKPKPTSTKVQSVVAGGRQERTLRQNSQSIYEGPNVSPEKNSSSGTPDSAISGMNHPAPVAYQEIGATRTLSDEGNDMNGQGSADELLSLSRDEHCTETDEILSTKTYSGQYNDLHHDTNERTFDSNVNCSDPDDLYVQDIEITEDQSHTSVDSSAGKTELITSDVEATASHGQYSNSETTTSSGNGKTESPSYSSATIPDPFGALPESHDGRSSSGRLSESSDRDSDLRNEACFAGETVFLDCMGSDFLTLLEELCSVTDEEMEYDSLGEIVCSKICEKEDDKSKWLLSPPESHRSAVDYVSDLFKDEVFLKVAVKKSRIPIVDESSFLSCDSLREALLDKAMKKFERLTHLRQKLDALVSKHDQLELKLRAVVKKKVEMKYFSKYCSVTEDLDKVTHLLLMLSSRLANTDVTLDQISFTENEEQKIHLIAKRENLIVKYDEAVSLKDSIENRRRRLTEHLEQRLQANELSDYQHFIKTKCQLKLIKQSIEDRLALSVEQRKVLVDLIERKTNAKYC